MTVRMITLLASLPAIAVLLASDGARLPDKAPASIELHDQYDKPQKVSFPASKRVVLAVADRKGSPQVDGWVAAVKSNYGTGVRLVGIANVEGAPLFLRSRIRKGFQKSRHYPVMMDWSGKVCKALGYRKEVANILVIDANGKIQGRFYGKADPDKVKRAFRLLGKPKVDE